MHGTEVRMFALICFMCPNTSLTSRCETELSHEPDIYLDDRGELIPSRRMTQLHNMRNLLLEYYDTALSCDGFESAAFK